MRIVNAGSAFLPGHGGDEPERVSTKKDSHIKRVLDPRLFPWASEI